MSGNGNGLSHSNGLSYGEDLSHSNDLVTCSNDGNGRHAHKHCVLVVTCMFWMYNTYIYTDFCPFDCGDRLTPIS